MTVARVSLTLRRQACRCPTPSQLRSERGRKDALDSWEPIRHPARSLGFFRFGLSAKPLGAKPFGGLGVRVSDTNTTLSVGEIKYDTKIVSLVDVSAQMEGSA
jgi:hypothetical protein